MMRPTLSSEPFSSDRVCRRGVADCSLCCAWRAPLEERRTGGRPQRPRDASFATRGHLRSDRTARSLRGNRALGFPAARPGSSAVQRVIVVVVRVVVVIRRVNYTAGEAHLRRRVTPVLLPFVR